MAILGHIHRHVDSTSPLAHGHLIWPQGHLVAGLLESANSSILAVRNLFKDFGGPKNQDFALIRLNYPSNMIGCGGNMHG